jgi:hypothetical protein
MIPRTLAALIVPVAAVALATGARAPGAAVYKDERIGFAINVPAKWSPVPIGTGEQWIVARWLDEKVDRYVDPDSGWGREHRSSLRVIAFIDEIINRPDVEVDEDEEGRSVTRIQIGEVFRDYEGFLKGTYPEGFYFSKEAVKSESNGLSVTQYEALVETSHGVGNKLLITWVFEMEVGDVAFEFEVLESELKKKESTFTKALRSVEEIERTIPINISEMQDFMGEMMSGTLSPEERAKHRRSQQDREWTRLIAALPEGWEVLEIDGVRVATASDEKHAKKVVERIVAVTEWLDDAFPDVGPAEFVRKPLVRICKDREEEYRFLSGSGGFWLNRTELVTHKSDLGAASSEWGYVCRRTAQIWFMDRDQQLAFALPSWLDNGLSEVLAAADVKGGKLRFKEGQMEQIFRSLRLGTGEPIPIRRLMEMTGRDFDQLDGDGRTQAFTQAIKLVRYMITEARGDAKEALPEYIRNVRAIVDEIDAEREAAGDTVEAPKTEEEEEAYFQQRQKRAQENASRIYEGAFERTFASWSSSKWANFEKGYLKSL